MTKRHLAIASAVAAMLVAACGSTAPESSPDASAPVGTFPSGSDVGRYFSIEEVGLGDDGWVTLLNYTDQPASLARLFLCQAPRCVELPDVQIGPGEVGRIATGSGTGIGNVAMTGADLELRPDDGEVAFYSSDDIEDPAAIRSYLEWGSTPHAGTATAIQAGLWLEGSFAPTASDATRLFRESTGLWLFDTE